jgi:hypothetical protein
LEYYVDEQNRLEENKGYDLTTVTLNTTDGKRVSIDLLNANVIDMATGNTLIIGKNYDIFAIPEEK